MKYACDRYILAGELYNAGYRKIPKNAVVITREEYNNMQFVTEFIGTKQKIGACDFNRVFLQHERKIRKETAEKFAEKVKEIKIRLDLIGNPYEKKYTQADLKEVANGVLNQFLRYIDEIAKEMEAIYAKYD